MGLRGIGLDAYWNQFAGLEERLKGHVVRLASRLARLGVEVVNLGLINTPERSREVEEDRKTRRAVREFSELDLSDFGRSIRCLELV